MYECRPRSGCGILAAHAKNLPASVPAHAPAALRSQELGGRMLASRPWAWHGARGDCWACCQCSSARQSRTSGTAPVWPSAVAHMVSLQNQVVATTSCDLTKLG
eukprot:scaffold48156_cov61-Phaeocystis_antarctica.AAC.1